MNLDGFKEYENGFKLSELYIEQTMGVLTSRDNFVIDSNINDLEKE